MTKTGFIIFHLSRAALYKGEAWDKAKIELMGIKQIQKVTKLTTN